MLDGGLMGTLITVVASVGASSGFWAWLQNRDTKKSATNKLILGLAHERIVFQGMSFVDRGWITKDEYDDFVKYLYEPYSKVGGNGLAEKIYKQVEQLPFRNPAQPLVEAVIEKDKT